MNKILKKEQLSDQVWRVRIEAPLVAQKRQAGQFVIVRIEPEGERIPLTIVDSEDNWIDLIVQVAGYTTAKLCELKEGDTFVNVIGPLGNPTHIEKFGRCLCIGGGVGIAALYPIVCALKKAGNHITTIIGARSQNLLLLEKECQQQSDQLHIATDDGSKGQKGFVSDVFKTLQSKGEQFDFAIVIGPSMMMKVTAQLFVAAGIKTMVSLNAIMIDGTGMCGGCRVNVHGKTQFTCVDGPEFDAAGIDWDSFLGRLKSYDHFEKGQYHRCKLANQLLGDKK